MTNDHFNDDEIPESAERWPNDGLDRLIAGTARAYNAPPPSVPRDAMWAAIVAARIPAAPDAAPAVAPAPVVVRSIDMARRHRTPKQVWWGLAAAAAIFLATGVGIGRWWAGPSVAAGPSTSGTTIGQVAAVSPTATPAAPASTIDSAERSAPVVEEHGTPDRVTVPATTRAADRRMMTGTNAAYDLAVVNHFAKAEALLVSYRADSLDAALDTRIAKWVRPMLADTRLLLDSPAADDPRRRRLLEDLELVLAQMARLAPNADVASDSGAQRERSERRLIDGAMRHAQLLPRLRTAVPAGS